MRSTRGTCFLPGRWACWLEPMWLTPSSKRKGFDKALFQIEQALKRVKSGKPTPEDSRVVLDLRHLLGDAADNTQLPGLADVPGRASSAGDTYDPDFSDDDQETENSPDSRAFLSRHYDGSLTVDDAENPLQLLARASNLQLSPTPSGAGTSPGHPARRNRRQKVANDGGKSDIESFFTGVRVNLDVGEDIDPIDMGLVTEAEADELFD